MTIYSIAPPYGYVEQQPINGEKGLSLTVQRDGTKVAAFVGLTQREPSPGASQKAYYCAWTDSDDTQICTLTLSAAEWQAATANTWMVFLVYAEDSKSNYSFLSNVKLINLAFTLEKDTRPNYAAFEEVDQAVNTHLKYRTKTPPRAEDVATTIAQLNKAGLPKAGDQMYNRITFTPKP